MRPCLAKTRTGEACPNPAGKSGYCFTHDPERESDRIAARRRGGLNRRAGHGGGDPGKVPAEIRSIADVFCLLDWTMAESMVLENSVSRARMLIQLAGVYVDAIEVHELEGRIEVLEEKFNDTRKKN